MHKQAALNTLKFFAVVIASSFAAILAIEFLSLSIFLTLLGIGTIAWFVHIFYSMEKSSLESLEKFKDIK